MYSLSLHNKLPNHLYDLASIYKQSCHNKSSLFLKIFSTILRIKKKKERKTCPVLLEIAQCSSWNFALSLSPQKSHFLLVVVT